MKSKLILILIFCVSLLLVGCGKSNPAVGTWKLALDPNMAKMLPKDKLPSATLDVKGDNTFTLTTEGGGKTSAMTGTYTLAEKTLSMTVTKIDGKDAPEAMKKAESATISEDGKSIELPGGMGKFEKQ